MSELTTGAVTLSLIGAPVAIAGAAIIGTAYATKWLHDNYGEIQREVLVTEQRLQWLDKQRIDSPMDVAKEAKLLQSIVINSKAYEKISSNLSVGESNLLTTAIVTNNSPLKNYIPKYLDDIKSGTLSFENAILKSTQDLAVSHLDFVSSVVNQAAKATGFNRNTNVIKNKKNIYDVVFTDGKGRNLTAYIKLNKELNPTLAIDLEGFNFNTNECGKKMDEIIQYLTEHGVPFFPKRIRHNNPAGVLHKTMEKTVEKVNINKSQKQKKITDQGLDNYLSGKKESSSSSKKIKSK